VKIGKNCKIQTNAFIPEGVDIWDNVFIGPNVTFCNVKHPMKDEKYCGAIVQHGAVIGAGAIILPNMAISYNAVVGAGSVVVKNVHNNTTVVGNPAKPIKPKEAQVEQKTISTTRGEIDKNVKAFLSQNPTWHYHGFHQTGLFNNPGNKIQPYPTKWGYDDRNPVDLVFIRIY